MDADEHILTHIVSVWREERKFLKRGIEGMLFLTEKHLMFILKTQAKLSWWDAATARQVQALRQSKSTMIHQDGYSDDELRADLKNDKNEEVSFDNILHADFEEKSWGNVMYLEINGGGKARRYQFSVVEGWVKYPLKDPIKFMKVDWAPFVNYIKSKQKVIG